MRSRKSAIEISGRDVGREHPCYIVAEIGSNHNHDLETARQLIDQAAEAGVDAVKFQTLRPDEFIPRDLPADTYGIGGSYPESTWQEVLENHLILPFEWYGELVSRIRDHDMDFVTTVHGRESLDLALQHSPVAIKTASMDLTHTPLLKAVAEAGCPMIVSTGMADLSEIDRAIRTIREIGLEELVITHCVSLYPASYDTLNLRAIPSLSDLLGIPVGFSDHSLGTTSAVVARTLGACVVEKHFTLNREATGPDHSFSLEPDELATLVDEIRIAEESFGSGALAPSETEKENRRRYRRSIVADGDLQRGETLTKDRIKYQRPGTGIPPSEVEYVVGKKLSKKVENEEQITWSKI